MNIVTDYISSNTQKLW